MREQCSSGEYTVNDEGLEAFSNARAGQPGRNLERHVLTDICQASVSNVQYQQRMCISLSIRCAIMRNPEHKRKISLTPAIARSLIDNMDEATAAATD